MQIKIARQVLIAGLNRARLDRYEREYAWSRCIIEAEPKICNGADGLRITFGTEAAWMQTTVPGEIGVPGAFAVDADVLLAALVKMDGDEIYCEMELVNWLGESGPILRVRNGAGPIGQAYGIPIEVLLDVPSFVTDVQLDYLDTLLVDVAQPDIKSAAVLLPHVFKSLLPSYATAEDATDPRFVAGKFMLAPGVDLATATEASPHMAVWTWEVTDSHFSVQREIPVAVRPFDRRSDADVDLSLVQTMLAPAIVASIAAACFDGERAAEFSTIPTVKFWFGPTKWGGVLEPQNLVFGGLNTKKRFPNLTGFHKVPQDAPAVVVKRADLMKCLEAVNQPNSEPSRCVFEVRGDGNQYITAHIRHAPQITESEDFQSSGQIYWDARSIIVAWPAPIGTREPLKFAANGPNLLQALRAMRAPFVLITKAHGGKAPNDYQPFHLVEQDTAGADVFESSVYANGCTKVVAMPCEWKAHYEDLASTR